MLQTLGGMDGMGQSSTKVPNMARPGIVDPFGPSGAVAREKVPLINEIYNM